MLNKTPFELQEVSELIGLIYDSSITGDWNPALNKIMTITNSNKTFFFLTKVGEEHPILIEFIANFDYDPNCLLDYQSRPFEDPFYNVTKKLIEGESINCNDEIDISEYEETDYYQNILAPMRSYYVLGGVLCRDGEYESAYSINRGPDDEPYSSYEIELFNALTPHLSRAMHIYKELRIHKNYTSIANSILDQENKGVLVCNSIGEVIFSNKFIKNYLESNNEIYIKNSQICLRDKILNTKFKLYIKQCSNFSLQEISLHESIFLDRNSIDDEALISISPLDSQQSFINVNEPCCLVTIKLQKSLNWQLIQKEFGLTPKELKLLKAIYQKKKLDEITTVFHVTYNTLRTHLQSIFRKVQVNSQTELMIRINLFR